MTAATRWIVDGNNVMGARPDRWWNDRSAAAQRLAQQVAEWCRRHGDPVVLIFDGPLEEATLRLAGGNLTIEVARRRGRNAADHEIVTLAVADVHPEELVVVTSDRGLRQRLPPEVRVMGAGVFRTLIEDSMR